MLRKAQFVFYCFLFCSGLLNAQTERYKEITNPNLTTINSEPARASFRSYTDENTAFNNDKKDTYYLSLNGEWKFAAIGDAFEDKSIVNTIIRVVKDYNK